MELHTSASILLCRSNACALAGRRKELNIINVTKGGEGFAVRWDSQKSIAQPEGYAQFNGGVIEFL